MDSWDKQELVRLLDDFKLLSEKQDQTARGQSLIALLTKIISELNKLS